METLLESVKPSTGTADWVDVCALDDLSEGTGTCARLGAQQVAVFRLPGGEVRAVQNTCPHKGTPVLHQGIVGDKAGEPKITCPLHKRAYSLEDGRNLTDEGGRLQTFPVRVVDGRIQVKGVGP